MSTPEQRRRMCAAIVDFEARRDSKGRIAVHKLHPQDGGGKFEVAGINERFHKETALVLVAMIEQGRHAEAEALAQDFVGQFTDVVVSWSAIPALEFYFRDSAFNRGPTGAAKILQMALGVEVDGSVGKDTRGALRLAEADALGLLGKLRAARERYEREVAKRDESSPFFKGLVNRWNKALDVAKSFPLTAGDAAGAPLSLAPPLAETAPPPAAIAPAVPPGPEPVLRALRVGMSGPRVAAWQTFLTGQGFGPGGSDGEFGEKTRDATKAFQAKHRLHVDGAAGRETLLKAASLGFELIEEPAEDASSSNFPPRPAFSPLINDAQRAAVFGRFDFVAAPLPKNPENIRILGTWARDNIVSFEIPQLKKALGSKAPKTVSFHRLAAKQMQKLWADWEEAGLLDRVISYHGDFVPRFVRGSTTSLSNHSFGSAFDINFKSGKLNGLGMRPALVGAPGSVRELVPIANRNGFYWGGHFQTRADGMHFEIAFLT
jgi:peptidoglycan hydrolase-like protein with peptidoglycan-binding domain